MKENTTQKKRRAAFVKLRVTVPEEKGVNRLLAVLLFCPIPIFVFKWIMRTVKTDFETNSGLTKKDIIDIVSTKGISVDVKSESGEHIKIRTF